MKINLTKGQTLNLSKETDSKIFEFRAKWDTSLAGNADIDIMSATCDSAKKALDFVFFNKLKSTDGSVSLSGDNRTGKGEGWDETITIDFSKMSQGVKTVPCIVSIYDAISKGLNFGLVKNLVVEIYDVTNQKSIAEFIPDLEASMSTAMVAGEFVENNGNFYFKALASGYNTINDIIAEYGINV